APPRGGRSERGPPHRNPPVRGGRQRLAPQQQAGGEERASLGWGRGRDRGSVAAGKPGRSARLGFFPHVDAELLALLVQVAAFEAEAAGGIGDVAARQAQPLADDVALERVAQVAQGAGGGGAGG